MKTTTTFQEIKRPEHAIKLFIRFVIAKGLVTYGLELLMSLFKIVQGVVSTIMVWKYIGELMFNILVLVGTVKASDRVVREMMGV